MGHPVERRRYGFYGRAGGARVARVTVAGLAAADVGHFIQDLREYFGGVPVRIVVDDLAVDEVCRWQRYTFNG